MSSLKAVKINNAAWLPVLSEHIEQLCKRAHIDGMQPGNLQAYFANIAQFGKDMHEFWVVFEDDKFLKPVAFAQWSVLGQPYVCKVFCFACHSWTKDHNATGLLVDEFIKFGDKHNAIYWSADFVGKANVRLFKKRMSKRGFDMKESNIFKCVFRRFKK